MPDDPLSDLAVPVPCTVPWESMTGDARRRFCSQCRLHVHDVSAMTRDEAIAFVARARVEGGACVRLHRRPDGRIVTRDCVEVVRRLRRRARFAAASVAAVLGLGSLAYALKRSADDGGGLSNPDLWERQPWATIAKVVPASWLPARNVPIVVGRLLLAPEPGDAAAPSPDARRVR
jgi:hypothetical protein